MHVQPSPRENNRLVKEEPHLPPSLVECFSGQQFWSAHQSVKGCTPRRYPQSEKSRRWIRTQIHGNWRSLDEDAVGRVPRILSAHRQFVPIIGARVRYFHVCKEGQQSTLARAGEAASAVVLALVNFQSVKPCELIPVQDGAEGRLL